jgi:hypothetical protein
MRLPVLALTAATVLALGLSVVTPGQADNAMAPPIDCSKAQSMMMAPAPEAAMKPMGSVDKDFAEAMMAQNKASMAMMKVELACGKDAKTKAMVKAKMEEMEQTDAALQRILSSTTF